MNISVGIVGLPNVGKSTLFNALTKKVVPAENYPFCTIDSTVGIVAVPDERLQQLSLFSKSVKTIPAVIEFVDIAGLVAGASEGAGLGNKFLSYIREVDAIAHVVRVFEDKNITHVTGVVDPKNDVETTNLELTLADLQTVSKRLNNLAKEIKQGDKKAIKEGAFLEKAKKVLEEGQLLSQVFTTSADKEAIRRFNLLSAKPMLYVFNKKADRPVLDTNELEAIIKKIGARFVVVDAGMENELSRLDPADRALFRKEFGALDDGINDLIKESYQLLGLITYFTTGPDETRAWTIPSGSTAPAAGRAIHSDFADKFIRAEIIDWQTLLTAGSYGAARDRGLIRTEGRDYIVTDGDVIEFKI